MTNEEIRAKVRAAADKKSIADTEVQHAFYKRNGNKLTSDGEQICPRCGDNNGTHHYLGNKLICSVCTPISVLASL